MEVVAYYLGQYSPNSDNDSFWGEGFTEWHNVAKARPLFPFHQQPCLPGKLGFYDLRSEEVLIEQQRLAKSYGITAFCHWHYWFSGKRLLHSPLDKMLELPDQGVKFMLGWANESWSGIWHGNTGKILIEQTYGESELIKHAKTIAGYLKSGRYLEIQGKFPFVIYKPNQIPNTKEYLDRLRLLVFQACGAELYIIGNWTAGREGEVRRPLDRGLDSVVITPVSTVFRNPKIQLASAGAWYLARRLGIGPQIKSYLSLSKSLKEGSKKVAGVTHSSVVTGWDNTPRSGRRGVVLVGFNEETFRHVAADAYRAEKLNDLQIFFVKSWNEWAEGNTVEPKFNEDWSVGKVLKEIINETV